MTKLQDFCCPSCGRLNISRYQRRCRYCRIKLIYVGETWVTGESGYIWIGRDGWIPLSQYETKVYIGSLE